MFREQLIHQLKLDEKKHEEKLQRERAKQMAQLQVRMCVRCNDRRCMFPNIQAEKALQEEQLSHLVQLKKLGVDLTTYLVSKHPKPDKILRVITKGEGQGGHVHIHP